MEKTICINRLYAWVLHNDMKDYNVSEEDIVEGIKLMKKAYDHKTSNLASEKVEAADFNSPAYRCAYLHKYAPIHTILVSDVAQRVIDLQFNYFYDVIINSGCVNVCSLGGGPGSDIVGIVLSLHEALGPFQVFTNVIDCMPYWNNTLNSLIRETQQGSYGILQTCFSPQYFNWNYIGANLLDEFSEDVKKAISSADILNMVKFVSAAVCVDTPTMIKRIFSWMKPGAMAFFLDNSVGKVKHILAEIAEECELEPLYGPISHEHYRNELVQTNRFGYSSCFQTNIAIQVWVKPHRPVQDWCGSPIQAWTPFEKTKRVPLLSRESFVNQSYSSPVFNNQRSAIINPNITVEGPFNNISKSLNFDDSEFVDNGPEHSFLSDDVEFPRANPVIPFMSTPNCKFEAVECNFDNSLPTNRFGEYNSPRMDSGCWSASSSFNGINDSSFNDVNYRNVISDNIYSRTNYAYSDPSFWNFNENKENFPPPAYKSYNNKRKNRFNPYKRR